VVVDLVLVVVVEVVVVVDLVEEVVDEEEEEVVVEVVDLEHKKVHQKLLLKWGHLCTHVKEKWLFEVQMKRYLTLMLESTWQTRLLLVKLKKSLVQLLV